MSTLAALRQRREWIWIGAAALAGAVAGALTTEPGLLSGSLVLLRWAALVAVVVWLSARPETGVWVAVAAFPLNDYGRIVTSPVPITLFQAALGAAIAGYAIRVLDGRVVLRRLDPMRVALLLPALAALWSLPFSLDPPRTAVAVLRLLALWLFALLVASLAEDPDRRERMLSLFVGIGVALTVVSLAQYAFPGLPIGNTHLQYDASGIEILTRPAAFYLDPNFLAGYLSVASLVAAVRVVHARAWRTAAVWAVPAAVCAGGVALTLSRSGLVGCAVGALAVVLTAPPRRRWRLLAIGLVLVVLAVPVMPDRYVDRITSLGDIRSEGSLSTRYLMFGSTLEIVRDYWGTGTGLAAFDVAYPPYRKVGALPRILRPHEVPLAMPAEMGVPGLLAELGLLGGLVWAFAAAHRRGWRAGDAAVLVGLVALLVQTWFQYYLYFEVLWLFAAFAAALPARTKGVSRA